MAFLNSTPEEKKNGKRITKYEFAGTGALIQLVGFILLFLFFPFGLIVGLPLLIIGSAKSKRILCSGCGNKVEKTTTLCPHCKIELE